MASSKVMASSSPANQDLQRHAAHTVVDHNNSNLVSMNMDDILKNIYDDSRPVPENLHLPAAGGGGDGKPPDESWKEIAGDPEMTLEDFLTKAGAVREEDVVKLSPVVSEYSGVIDPIICAGAGFAGTGTGFAGTGTGFDRTGTGFAGTGSGVAGTGAGVEGTGGGAGSGTGSVISGPFEGVTQQHMQFGRGKRKVVVEDAPVDKATQQKQRRMIKNRESAARSRERKQAYTEELESLVTQLEEEHARLVKEVDELNKERLKQLMENLKPVAEKRKPPRQLRRTNSM